MPVPDSILACDLDGTLIPPAHVDAAEGVAAFRASVGARDGLSLVYVTGRHLSFAIEGVRLTGLPLPDALVCDVGTSLHHRVGERFEADAEYAEAMRAAMHGRTGDDARAALRDVPGLEMQEASKQGAFKASYSFPPERGDEILRRAARALAEAGVQVNLVASRDFELGHGLLDALPPGVAKDYALHHLSRGEEGRPALTFAGDSGNDLAALLSGYDAILVGNARPELAAEVRREAEERGLLERVYFARTYYAEGVLEGCRHFGVL